MAAALHLAERGRGDGNRLAIHGGSAGGYTTLCALAFGDEFAAGASYYGVADAETMARTRTSSSRATSTSLRPVPRDPGSLRERSPIHYADRSTRR